MKRSKSATSDWKSKLDELRTLIESSPSRPRGALAKLKQLETSVQAEIEIIEDARRRRIVGPRARVRAAIYTIEDSPRGPALTERRDSDARPFKCPKNAYEAVAAVLAESKVPVGFQDIKAKASKRLRQELPDYAIRTPLRFWSTIGLLEHQQARFLRVGTKAEFMRGVKASWKRASLEPIEINPD
ncbi:MAG: hypothetical protein JKX70_01695 [Phycisphaerales bacterium]|nr:hypothetical protein [Phycisphaerales bacterium]